MPADYVKIKVEMSIKREYIIDAMKGLGIKINKKNERLYIDLLKRRVLSANPEFARIEIDKETLLMYGFTFS